MMSFIVDLITMANGSSILKPFLARLIVGSNSLFHGNRPWVFHALYMANISPGTATDNLPWNRNEGIISLF